MSTRTPLRVLFLCTGNYYRSRFAEVLFNHLALERGLPWLAFSRALAIERGHENVGPISPHTLAALELLQIPVPAPMTEPAGVKVEDFHSATRVIALKNDEHRPLVDVRWPEWVDKIEYWQVHDLDLATPEEATAEIEKHVRQLVEELATKTNPL